MNLSKDFFDRYELIFDLNEKSDDTLLPEERRCRFCKKSSSDTTFLNVSHTVPELLGQNDFIASDECDICNKHFSKFESHLSNFLRPFISVLAIETKEGVPTFQSRSVDGNNNTRTIFKVDRKKNRELIIQNPDDLKVSEDGYSFSLRFRKAPYIPVNVYKALLKIGLSVISSIDLMVYQNSIKWLLEEPTILNRIPGAIVTILTTRYFTSPDISLYKAKREIIEDVQLPEYTLIVATANVVIQIFFPFSDKFVDPNGIGRTPQITYFPAVGYEKPGTLIQSQAEYYDLRGQNTVKEDQWLSFTSKTRLNPPWMNISSPA